MKHHLLDHGYLEVIETWGSDERIVEAARMSTAKGFLGWGGERCPTCEAAGRLDSAGLMNKFSDVDDAQKCCGGSGRTTGDEKLLKFLYENQHATPFEMAGIVVEVKAPIFVFREWHRHRTQSYNEMSARYIPLPDENYIPSIERLMINSKTNKQAGTIKGADELTHDNAAQFRSMLRETYSDAEMMYQWALKAGVPKELARVHLPIGRYSCMRASANLRNWLGFLTLRMATGAQWEIRQYANALAEIVADKFPRTYALFSKQA